MSLPRDPQMHKAMAKEVEEHKTSNILPSQGQGLRSKTAWLDRNLAIRTQPWSSATPAVMVLVTRWAGPMLDICDGPLSPA